MRLRLLSRVVVFSPTRDARSGSLWARKKWRRVFDGPVRSFTRSGSQVQLRVAFTLKPLRAEETSLYVLGRDSNGGLRCLRTMLPGRSTRLDLIDRATGAITRVGRYHGDAFQAEISLPLIGFAVNQPIFMKLDRRVWFFDEAGWIEIPSVSEVEAPLPQLAVA